MKTAASGVKTIKIRKKLRDNELGIIRYNTLMRHRVLLNAIFNLVIFSLLLLVLVIITFKTKFMYLTTVPAVYAITMIILAIILIFYDIKSVDQNVNDFSKKPHWINIATMLYYSLGLFLGFAYIVWEIVPNGLSSYVHSQWPGGVLLYLGIPLVSFLGYNVSSIKSVFSFYDAFMVSEIMFGVYIISYVLMNVFGTGGNVVDAFTSLVSIFVNLALMFLSTGCLYLFNLLNVKVSDINKKKIISIGWRNNSKQLSLMGMLLSNQHLRQGVYLIMNISIVVISVKTVLGNLKFWPGYGWLSVPAMMCEILILISIVSIPINIMGIKLSSANVYPRYYKYLSFGRCVASVMNMIIAVVYIVMEDGELIDIFSPRLGGDAFTFVVCPILAIIFILMEATEYSLIESMLSTLPFCIAILLSRLSISLIKGYDLIEGEMEIFFNGNMLIASVFTAVVVGLLIFVLSFINANDERFMAENIIIERVKGENITFSVCGARDGVAPTSSAYYEFGQASNCFVLRDGSYGLIIDCGCGLVSAPEILKGCTNVDILLSNTNFSTVMGLLATPNPCPDAKVRIFGPFGNGRNFINMNGFAVPPLWPVNVIVGDCISALPDREIPLNNMYSVCFTPTNDKATHYMIRISGAVSIAYTGAISAPNEDNMEWANDCDLFIYNSMRGWKTACEIAKKIGAGYLLIANHDSFENDASLRECEKSARGLFQLTDYARQGTEYRMI